MSDGFSTDQQEVDLFGNKLEPIRDRRGRPSFKKTKENQDFVAIRAASGWTRERIAEGMGIDVKTLRNNFSQELVGGAMIIEGLILDVLLHKVRLGHTPSIRVLQDRLKEAAPAAPRKPLDDVDAALEKPQGKKAQALVDAQDVPDDYGDIFKRRQH